MADDAPLHETYVSDSGPLLNYRIGELEFQNGSRFKLRSWTFGTTDGSRSGHFAPEAELLLKPVIFPA